MKKLSIITINYNNLPGLKNTVDSVQRQQTDKIQYIIIDGGSTDGSAEYLLLNKEKFHTLIIEKDYGIYDAMNKGLRYATGEYVFFLNSGDYFYNDDLINRINFENSNFDLLVGKILLENGGMLDKLFCINNVRLFLKHYTFPHQATIIKRALFSQIGYYNTLYKIRADYEWFVRAYTEDLKTEIMDEIFCVEQDGGISKRESNSLRYKIETWLIRLFLISQKR